MIKQILSNSLVRRSSVYMFFNILNGSIPFLLLPILTIYLNPTEYGNVELLRTTLFFLTPLIGIGMGMNIDRLFFKVSKESLSITIGSMVIILFFNALLFTVLLFILSLIPSINSFLDISLNWLLLIPITATASQISSYNLVLLRNLNKSKRFGFWQISLTIVNYGLSVLFVVVLLYGWQGRAAGVFISTLLLGFLSLINIYKMGYLKIAIYLTEIKEILMFSFPLILHAFSAFVILQSNKYILNDLVGKNAVGIYSVATSFAAITSIVSDAVVKTINPWFYKNLNITTISRKRQIRKMNLIINSSFLLIAFLIYLISILLIKYFIDEKFHEATPLVFWLSLGFAFKGMYKLNSVYFINLSKTSLLATLTTIVAFISVGLNFFFINNYGQNGAAYAFCLSLAIFYALTKYFSPKSHTHD